MKRVQPTPLALLCVLVVWRAPSAKAETALVLPPPTGPHAVGRVTYDWTDSARGDALAPTPAAARELVVDVWYPAKAAPGQASAEYLPDFAALRRAVGEAALRAE